MELNYFTVRHELPRTILFAAVLLFQTDPDQEQADISGSGFFVLLHIPWSPHTVNEMWKGQVMWN